jgi:carboxyl-terminal processing protease
MSIGKIAMDVKIFKIGLRTAVCTLALLAVAPTTLGQRPHSTAADSPEWTEFTKARVLDRMSKYILKDAYVPNVDFSKWDATMAKIRPEAEKAKTEEEFAAIVDNGLRNAFNISHIVLLPPAAVDQRINQKMVGIGIRIDIQPEGVLVTSTVPGAPAEKAGIEPGDLILEADGHHAERQYIAGPEGTSVDLKVRKADGKTVKMYKVTRASFKTTQKEELTWVDKDTAAIKIYTFDLSYDYNNVQNLMKEANKAKNLIVDLRGNGGGAVGNMMHFLSTVLDPGTEIGTFINKRSYDDYLEANRNADKNDLAAIAKHSSDKLKVRSSGTPVFKGHIAVLVNGGSGSASEITAEALKELVSAPVVGKKSAGAVLVSVMGELPHGFNLQYPISDYISTKGIRLEANGIVPDTEANDVNFVKKGEIDPAYTTAEGLLNKIAKSGQ